VHGHQTDTQLGDPGGCSFHGGGDVVQLDVEEHRSMPSDRLDRRRTVGGEELQAHLEPTDRTDELLGERLCGPHGRHVQRDDEPFAGLEVVGWLGAHGSPRWLVDLVDAGGPEAE
jgi:hypothetical protein